MATNRQQVLERARQWASQSLRLRWNRVANNCFEGDSLFLWSTGKAGNDLPRPDETTGVNCFEIFMLVMCHVDDRPASEKQNLIRAMLFEAARLSGQGKQEPDPWPRLLTRDGLTGFALPNAIPEAGQLVFLNDSGHVVMANGIPEGTGRVDASRIEVLSFYGGYPAIPANTKTPSPLAIATLAEILDYFAALKILELEAHNQPVTPPAIDVRFGDPFWA
ncbi:MAG: hypothetical protein L0271_08480 [Gemmatimonadetes bacterium]|nr:hypothetical protein [Gemmatimonadota bacterium]